MSTWEVTMSKAGLIFLLGSMMILGACVIALVDYEESRPVEEFLETIPFIPDGELDLITFDGNIEINGWDQREVEIYAERYLEIPREGNIQFVWNKRMIPRVNVENYDDAIKISTRAPSQTGALVDYFINVPRSIHLKDIIAREGRILISGIYGSARAELAAGDIDVENFSGSLTALVTVGSITARLYDLRAEDEVILNCREGDIAVFFQEGVHASVHAEALNGTIRDEFQLERKEDGFIDSPIGKGGASVRVTALNGNIRISKIVLE
jgi:hypothetical protein